VQDVPLSSRLAALRMQLEEKRRQFEEEKKTKLKEWNEVYIILFLLFTLNFQESLHSKARCGL